MSYKPKCQICSSDQTVFLMKKEQWPLYQCQGCGLIFVFPLPSDQYLREEVYSTKSGYQRKKSSNRFKNKPTPRFERFLNFIEKDGNGRKILDVGCSSGEFLYFAQKKGYQVWGVEVNEKTAHMAINDGLNVFIGSLREAAFENIFFDYILIGDVLEHVPDPSKLLAECTRILKKGGKIIISTPNVDCFWSQATLWLYKVFKIPWSSADPPGHLFYFSSDNLDLLMKNFYFKPLVRWYNKKLDLRHEVGCTHLWRRFKDHKTIKNLTFLIFAFWVYFIFYFFDSLIRPFKKQDFIATIVYGKAI